jgi:hypothetical protein
MVCGYVGFFLEKVLFASPKTFIEINASQDVYQYNWVPLFWMTYCPTHVLFCVFV